MSLSLPPNFAADIQGKDTNLIPIVEIGNVIDPSGNNTDSPQPVGDNFIISVGSQAPYDSLEGRTTLPLLLNIPSLKESIDIEKRNYKISSVNIDISNFPYEGKRFSELIGDNSLINTECRIWWATPNSTSREYFDLGYEMADTAQLEIYYGTIRKYDMTDEKVRLVVEDRSQATLHKDLPITDLGDAAPDKNKKYPFVYGSVDGSPMVVSAAFVNEEGYPTGDTILKADNDDSVIIEKLYLHDEVFINVYSGGDGVDGVGGMVLNPHGYDIHTQLEGLSTNTIRLLKLGGNESFNPIFDNKLVTEDVFELEDISIIPLKSNNEGLANAGGYDKAWNTAIYNSGTVIAVGVNGNSIPLPDRQWIAGTLISEQDGGFEWDGSSLISPEGLENTTADIDNTFTDGTVGIVATAVGFKGIIENHSDYGNAKDSKVVFKQHLRLGAANNLTLDTFAVFLRTSEDWDGIPQHEAGFTLLNDVATQTDGYLILNATSQNLYRESNSSEIYCYIRPNYEYTQYYGGSAAIIIVEAMEIRKYALYENVIKLNYYGKVEGRLDSDTALIIKAPEIISHILNNELGQTGITVSSDPTYDSWKYAFTVDSKISSKKLIEGIASASPYIPRFDNMGVFKFDVIPEDGGTADFRIKEADCIDFSFSRSKIGSVKTRIILKYNWDYARGEFNDSVEVEMDDVIGADDYKFDYYGLKDDHSESTLIIDGKQGKYIRNDTTAEDFARWYLMWSLNQHLKMKIKLPLKYMNLEIGDSVDFDAILGGVEPYGIGDKNATDNFYDDKVNGQRVFKNFLIVSTNKTLEWVEIECIQMHNLEAIIHGCMADGTQTWGSYPETEACNYDADAEVNFGCDYGTMCWNTNLYCDEANCPEQGDEPDCAGVPGGGALEDECGVCEGDGIAEGACDCDGNVDFDCGCGEAGPSGCDETCGSELVDDDCGECGGTNSTCLVCPGTGVELWGEWYDYNTVEIDRGDEGLGGTIPAEIGCFLMLETLKLNGNGFTGGIPSSIGDLTNPQYLAVLNHLDLSGNNLTNSIPTEIGNLTNLTYLNLAGNSLSGEIPSEIGILTTLQSLDLSENTYLIGEIPLGIWGLTNLTYLNLSRNQLWGAITYEIQQMTNLDELDLFDNQLSGVISTSICMLVDAGCTINLDNNNLCPAFFGTEHASYPFCLTDAELGEQDTSECAESTAGCPHLGNMNNDFRYPGPYGQGCYDGEDDDDCVPSFNVLDLVILCNCVLAEAGSGQGTGCAEYCEELVADEDYSAPGCFPCAGDLNGDGLLSVLDIVTLANCVLAGNCSG